jgi:hypothetical protein
MLYVHSASLVVKLPVARGLSVVLACASSAEDDQGKGDIPARPCLVLPLEEVRSSICNLRLEEAG